MKLRPHWAALVWALFILVLCILPGPAIPSWDWADMISFDKSVHAVLFCVLYVLVVNTLAQQYRLPALRSHAMAAAFLMTVGYGAFTELMQQFPVFGRRGDPLDLLANSVGAMLGLVYFRLNGVSAMLRMNEKDG